MSDEALIKIKQNRGNRKPKTKKQIETSKLNGKLMMTFRNPMKNPESLKNNLKTRHWGKRRWRKKTKTNILKKIFQLSDEPLGHNSN